MNRNKEFEVYIQDYLIKKTELDREYFLNNYKKLLPEFHIKWNYLIQQWKSMDSVKTYKIKYIYLNRLMSSVYTDNYETVLGIAGSDLYIDNLKIDTYWYPDLIFENINYDMKVVKTILNKRFIRVEKFELFYLKKILFNKNWELLQQIFNFLIQDSRNLIMDSLPWQEGELQIVSGDYMGKPKCLLAISKEIEGKG